MNIMVEGKVEFEELVDDLEKSTNLKANIGVREYQYRQVTHQEHYYEFYNDTLYFSVHDGHDLENDGEVNFEDFRFNIRIRAKVSRAERDEKRLEYGWLIFNILKENNKYQLMMVENVQRVLARYTPE